MPPPSGWVSDARVTVEPNRRARVGSTSASAIGYAQPRGWRGNGYDRVGYVLDASERQTSPRYHDAVTRVSLQHLCPPHTRIDRAYQTCRTERCRRCVAGRSAAQRCATRPITGNGSARRRPLRRANVCINLPSEVSVGPVQPNTLVGRDRLLAAAVYTPVSPLEDRA
jgi:hypothetical protein